MSSLPLPSDAEFDEFDATLAFLDEYNASLDLPVDAVASSSDSSATGSSSSRQYWSSSSPSAAPPIPILTASDHDGSETTVSPNESPSSSPAPLARKPQRTASKRGRSGGSGSGSGSSQADDPRMSAKTIEEGGYPSRTRKAELAYLRTKVQELDEKLRVLKQSKRQPPAPSLTESSSSSNSCTETTTSEDTSSSSSPDQWEAVLSRHQTSDCETRGGGGGSMWEDVAMRQFEQRQRAEIENQKLRSMLEAQLKLARGLERLLKRTNTDLFLPTNPLKRPRVSPDGSVDGAAFDDLLTVVDEMYTQLESVFSDTRFDREDLSLRDIQVNTDATYGTVVDIFDARNLPFELRATADAVWKYFANPSPQKQQPFMETTDDLIKRHFSFVVDMQRFQAIFRGRLAGKRYFEQDRIVILWVAMIEPEILGSSSSSSEGMVVQQKGWTIVKRPNRLPPNCDPEETANIARIQSKHVAIPFVYDDVPDQKRKVGTLTNFVLHSVYSHLQTSQKMVENILIEHAMKK